MVAFESIGSGTPVIGFRTGGLVEIIQHDVNGLIVDRGNVDQLREAIVGVLDDRDRWSKWPAESTKWATSHFSLSSNAQSYRALYDELLSR